MHLISTALILLSTTSPTVRLQAHDVKTTQYVVPKISAISLFKNGYVYVTREIPVKDGGANVVEIPPASLGTLWFWTDSGTLDSITSDEELNKKVEVLPLESIAQLLEKNVGKTVVLDSRSNVYPSLEGKIISASGELLVIEVRGEKIAIPKSTVTTVRSTDASFAVTTTKETASSQRFYRVKVSGKAKSVMMMSLERGATWAPAYAIDITDPKKLNLISRATILNDVFTFDSVNTRLITGFPNLQFKDILEPLTAQMSLDEWLGYLAQESRPGGGFGGGGRALNNRREVMSQAAYNVAAPPAADWSSIPTNGGQGEKLGDLFFYDLHPLTLKKGARVMETLFRAESAFEHIYCWDLEDDVVNNVDFRPIDRNQPPAEEEVWHALKFKNTAGQPLTTGPASIFEKGQLIGQAMTTYVPNGADAELRISKALDISPEQAEEEVARERGAIKNQNGYPIFDLVTVKGTLVVKNRKSEKVKVAIKKRFTGEFIDSDHPTKLAKSVKGIRDANPTGTINWTEEIAGGESVTIKYQYKIYIRTQN